MKAFFSRFDLLATIIIFLLMIPAEYFELFSTLENQTVSARHIWRTTQGDPAKVAFPEKQVGIVYLNEAFFEEYESYPLRRADVGTMVSNLRQLGARVVVVDMLMDYASSYFEDPIIAKRLKEAGSSILVSMLVIKKGQIEGIQYPTQHIKDSTLTGYSNHTRTGSMLNRLRIHPSAEDKYQEWPASVKATAMYLGVTPKRFENTIEVGNHYIELDHFNDFRNDFVALTPGDSFLHENAEIGVPAMAVLELDWEEEDEVEELTYLVKDKIIFIGDTSEVSHDLFDTVMGEVYGVEIMANEVATILKGAPLKSASFTIEIVQALLFLILLISIHFVNSPKLRYSGVILLFAGYAVVSTYLYLYMDLVLSMSYIFTAGVLGFFLINVYLYIQERKQKSFITNAFGQYLSPAVIDVLVEDPTKLSLGGERREMTAFFSDVAGFSSISESLTPEELVQLLNEYLTEMCQIISHYDGTVDKFEGDAIIAFWGAPIIQPNHAELCCFAAVDMQNALIEMRREHAKAGRPELMVRMGVNTGPMVVGNMGSQTRMDYTIMGDAVNLAARLEGANKFYKNHMMISQFTYEKIKNSCDVRELDTITVVGKDEPIVVYDLLEKKGLTKGIMADLVPQYEKALAKYKQKDFPGAIQEFEKALKILPTDGPSLTYLKRCQGFVTDPPPANWDLIHRLTEKG